mmetsp:Transcript_5275/g.11558  ORF Transcript_5275/g.11558 Transcript_5275/m.11558 type:complete len:104 (+) Transcript_5275:64-375(+)|eukprot:CAMPEP_0202891148 /NCGR_PEP_ID=MMETSP1392-20130828/1295_1 /ASSEMBLY_ACC=CAM_ASM_000868 /TAXON_ID=225041 /ORGANISM="Chlamydomonas chlamydogama, Strain SAG 11-48b" /LENGTH=103 /DNA_ID=CAMNT_0049574827 /DNA_START=64 /DNA_END=375 /DNA_ORIENTATION=+
MSGDGEPIVKPEPVAGMEVVVKDQEGAEVRFKVKTTVKLEKIFKVYCEKKAKQPTEVRFMFDGRPLQGDMTAADAGLEDGDVIDAFIGVTGGCCCFIPTWNSL